MIGNEEDKKKIIIKEMQEELEDGLIKEKQKNINQKRVGLHGLGIVFIVMFTFFVLISGFWSFLSLGFTGHLSFGLIFIDLFSLIHIGLGIYFVSSGDRGINRKNISIALFSLSLLSVLFTFYGILILRDEIFIFMIPLIIFSVINLCIVSFSKGVEIR